MGDARDLRKIADGSIDLVLTHPPYADIIKYSEGTIKGDLSNIHSIDSFCDEIEIVARECFRVLKPDKYCAILIGDTRRNKFYIPLAYRVFERLVGDELFPHVSLQIFEHLFPVSVRDIGNRGEVFVLDEFHAAEPENAFVNGLAHTLEHA